jgi:SagB-type dehydrogenase family enzyme
MGKSQKHPETKGIGEVFQEETKYTPEKLQGHGLDWDNMPDPYKQYEAPLTRIALPKPRADGEADIWQLLHRRRSTRIYAREKTVPQDILSALLWATQGLTASYGTSYFRTAPSAGGLYPVETYLGIRSVEGLEPGLYHFRPRAFDLELLKRGDNSRALTTAALQQEMVMDAQVTFIWSALMARGTWKYRQRAYRYVYIDAGHIAQNLYLAAGALGLGVCAIGAFFDDRVNELVGLDGVEETVIYMACVGWPTAAQ